MTNFFAVNSVEHIFVASLVSMLIVHLFMARASERRFKDISLNLQYLCGIFLVSVFVLVTSLTGQVIDNTFLVYEQSLAQAKADVARLKAERQKNSQIPPASQAPKYAEYDSSTIYEVNGLLYFEVGQVTAVRPGVYLAQYSVKPVAQLDDETLPTYKGEVEIRDEFECFGDKLSPEQKAQKATELLTTAAVSQTLVRGLYRIENGIPGFQITQNIGAMFKDLACHLSAEAS